MNIPVVLIGAMEFMAKQQGVHRIVRGVGVAHPCGDPKLPPEEDRELRREVIRTALKALQTLVQEQTIFRVSERFASSFR